MSRLTLTFYATCGFAVLSLLAMAGVMLSASSPGGRAQAAAPRATSVAEVDVISGR